MSDNTFAGSGLASPVALSGLPLGAMGEGGGMGQTMSQDPTKGAMGGQKGDQNQMDPLLLQAIMAQLMGGQGAGLGNLSLTQGVGGQSLGQFGVPFGGMGAPQGAVAGPGQQPQGQGTSDPFSQIKSILGGISTLSKLAMGGSKTASPTTDQQTGLDPSTLKPDGSGGFQGDLMGGFNEQPVSGNGVSLGTGGGSVGGIGSGGPTAQIPLVGNLSPQQFMALSQSGLTPQQISAFMAGGNLAQGQVSGGELGMDFGGSLGASGGGGTLGQISGVGTQGPGTMSGGGGQGFGLSGGLGTILGAIPGLFNLGTGIAQGDLFGSLRSALGLGNIAASAAFPGQASPLGALTNYLGIGSGAGAAGAEAGAGAAGAAAGGEAAGEAAAGAGAAGAGAWILAPIVQSLGTGLSIAQRAEQGQLSEGEQAGAGALDLLFQGLPIAGPIISGAIEQALFGRYANANERNAMDLGVAGRDINQALPGIHAAGDPTELANSLFPLFEGRYNNQPYPILSGVGETDYNMGGPGMQKYPNIEQMAALFGGKDPNAVQFSWEQGVRPQDTATFSNFLDQTVRDQMQLFQAAQSGDPMAQGLLQFYQQQNQARKADAQSRADQMYYSMNHQPPGDPTGA